MNTSSSKENAAPVQSKMSLFSCVCMTIGGIIGAGIFGSIASAANAVGTGILWAYVGALFASMFRYLPSVVNASILPAPAANYMHATRLLNPTVGFLQATFGFNYMFFLASLANVFAEYFGVYVPGANPRLMGVAALLIFAVITCLGISATTKVQNSLTILLTAALTLFIVFGLPHIDSANVTFQQIIKPDGMTLVTLGAAVALLTGSLQGGHACIAYAHELKNPGRDLAIAYFSSTFFCCILFMLIALVSVGVIPASELQSLKDVAQLTLPPVLFHFFIIGGAIFATLTTIIGQFLCGLNVINTAAEDYALPTFFAHKNRYGVAQNSVVTLAIGSCLLVLTGLPVGTLLSAYSLLNLISGLTLYIPVLRVHKLYPNCYKNAYLKLTPTLIKIICALGTVVAIWQLYSLFLSLRRDVLICLFLWLIGWYAYYFIRKSYLKNKGIDLEARMREPYPEWTAQEKAFSES